MKKMKSLKIKFQKITGEQLLAETTEGQPIILVCNDWQQQELKNLAPLLSTGRTFNLLNISEKTPGYLEAEYLILEPNFLIDISSLAECFRSYGHHPLNYTLSRLRHPENTKHLLLGNAANFFMDELVYEEEDSPVDYLSVLKKLFQFSPFEITACEDLKHPDTEASFFADCRKHFENIRYAIRKLFPQEGIDREKVLVEPSFISNELGLQGRLDLMLDDFSAFVELKSGKGMENFRENGVYMYSSMNHYIQMILYLAVLQTNLNLQADDIRSYLFYSKYPVLSLEKHSQTALQKAITLRNTIVAIEYNIQKQNRMEYTTQVLSYVRPAVMNTAQLTGNFFENYLKPSIDLFGKTIQRLNDVEKAYFMRIYTFITKELWLSKVGERDYEGSRRAANLWNAPFEEKREAGELVYDLQLQDNQSGTENHFIVLKIPASDEIYLPNFRSGDAVVLYERNNPEDCVNNKQVFRGAIEQMDTEKIRIRLRAKQQSPSVLKKTSRYALEHDYMDSTYTGMFRALMTFAEANQDRKDLLLGRREPDGGYPGDYPPDDIQRAVSKAISARDCFLLVGPPGTGKTSLALKQIVETFLSSKKGHILLLSYTNRAVDEICKALSSISETIHYIRIGNELNCAPEYQERLLDKQLDSCHRRSEVEKIITGCRIFIGTVASVWNKQELFKLKPFDLLVVDEATQLLEPHLLGVLCAKTKEGKNAIERFVLIGDHKQLPAVILQSPEESKVSDPILNRIGLSNLNCSLFERLYRKYKENDTFHAFDSLSFQGRMHPEIAAFPSDHFYDGKLKAVGLPHQTEHIAKGSDKQITIDTLVSDHRLAFIAVTSDCHKMSKANDQEARVAVHIAQALFEHYRRNNKDFTNETLGIITPFRNQIALIRKYLKETNIAALNQVSVDTVERFQGSQNDVIIYSFCIHSPFQLETLPCMMEENGKLIDRKLNVVLTRAKKQLFIVGDPELLCKNELYTRLIEHIKKHGILFSHTATISSFSF